MIICNKCNHQNGDEATFCASCNAFLAWDGTRVNEPAPPPPEPEPEPVEAGSDPSRPGLIQRVKAVVLDQGPATPTPVGGSVPPADAPGTPAPQSAPAGWAGSPQPGPTAAPPLRPPGGPSGPPPAPAPGPWGAQPGAGPPPAPAPPRPAVVPPPPTAPPPSAPPAHGQPPRGPGQPPGGYGAPPAVRPPAAAPGPPAPAAGPGPGSYGAPPGAPPRPPAPGPGPGGYGPPPTAPRQPPAPGPGPGGYGPPPSGPQRPPQPGPGPDGHGPPTGPPRPPAPDGYGAPPTAHGPAPSGPPGTPPSAPRGAPPPQPAARPGGPPLGGAAVPPAGPGQAPGGQPGAPGPAPRPPAPVPTPTPSESFDIVPDAEAAARSRQEAENARRYAAERARQEAEEAEREAFRKRQEAAAALFEAPVAAAPTPLPGTVPPPTDSGRWGPAPAPTPAPNQPGPQAQLPGAAEAKRFAPRPVTQQAPPKPGDLVCGSCGAGNAQDRKFCRQCGASLVAAVVEPKLPWWKRIFQRSKKVPPPVPTGPGRPSKRTQRKRTTRRIIGYIRMGAALLAVLAVLGIAFFEPWRKAASDFTSCKKRQIQALVKPPVKNVPLKSATATTEFGNHQAFDAFDSSPATFWQAGPPPPPGSPPQDLRLTVEFVEPATVRQIHFFPGLPKVVNATSHPTPKTVLMTFRNEKGETVGKQERIPLETNVAKEDQLLKLKAKKNVRSVEIAILEVFPAQGSGTQVAISDVQFFGSPAQASGSKCNVS